MKKPKITQQDLERLAGAVVAECERLGMGGDDYLVVTVRGNFTGAVKGPKVEVDAKADYRSARRDGDGGKVHREVIATSPPGREDHW